jgi:hypothetical protein
MLTTYHQKLYLFQDTESKRNTKLLNKKNLNLNYEVNVSQSSRKLDANCPSEPFSSFGRLTHAKDPLIIVQEAGWAPGPF